MARGTSRDRGAVLLAAAVLVLALGCASSRALDGASAAPRAEPSAATPNLAKRLLLRLHDLPLGYRLLDFGTLEQPSPLFGCYRIQPAEPRPRLASFLERYEPRGCMAVYYRLFRVPGGEPAPLLVGSAASELGSIEGAEAGLAASRELLSHLFTDEMPEEAEPPEVIGDATRLFHWRDVGLVSRGETVSVVVWRWGGSVGLVLVGGEQTEAADAAAFEFAHRQQKHMEAPTPFLPAERDDSEVALEDPALRVPVYWLGETFEPRNGLPRLRFAESASIAKGEPDNPRVTLLYANRLDFQHAHGLEIDTWTRRQWKERREFRQPPFSLGCRKTRHLDLRRGHAVLYRGVEPGFACRSPRRRYGHMAAVHVDGVVIVVATRSFCESCGAAANGPYNSFRGMAAIARGLERRLGGTRLSGAPDLLAAPVARADSKPSGKLLAGAEETVLRLHDLPPGYVIEGDSDCHAFEPSGFARLKALDRWIVENWPEGCEFEYERRFPVPGYGPTPFRVRAETINTPSARAAARGAGILLRLIPRLTNWRRQGEIGVGPNGPRAIVFHFQARFGGDPEPSSVLVWRHGKLLAALEVSGMTPQENDAAALHYAQIQQRRLESPSPYTEAERDDTEVELDDPNLTVPVYWVGRAFDPGEDWPTAALETATLAEEDGLPGVRIILRYTQLNIETWTRQSWKRFQGSFLGKVNRPRCTRTTAFEWEHGHAVISAGYRRRTFDEGCPRFPPTRYWAVAHIGGVVVGVNQTTCRCLSPGSGPYSSSLRGMKTLLRGLTLRPKTAY